MDNKKNIAVAAAMITAIMLATLAFFSGCSVKSNTEVTAGTSNTSGTQNTGTAKDCMTREEVNATADRCLVIYYGSVYDVTVGKQWGLAGHFEHKCGKEYSTETIESGGHSAAVMKPFYYKKLCE
jgi:hypothetical protein